jgi:hypothetical protein
VFEGSTSTAPMPREGGASTAKRPRRRPHYRKELTRIDRRSRAWRRICELTELFTSALGEASVELSPMRRMRIEEAAQLKALAEQVRSEFLRGQFSDLDELVRAERHAAAAVRKLGLPYETPKRAPEPVPPKQEPPKPPTLAEYIAAKGAVAGQGSSVAGLGEVAARKGGGP